MAVIAVTFITVNYSGLWVSRWKRVTSGHKIIYQHVKTPQKYNYDDYYYMCTQPDQSTTKINHTHTHTQKDLWLQTSQYYWG